ncbi:MAG: hypothetical protein M3550_18030 [Actinomycetota bacterium]|nr:hypothetical protein [Actinomycetota bacterium]
MSSLARIAAALIVCAVLAVAQPGSVAGDGLPAGDVYAAPVFVPGGGLEYTTVSVGRNTIVQSGERGGRGLVRTTRLRGDWVVPAVAYDGSPGGLSADGRTLVLINPRRRFPRATTSFAILDAQRLRLRRLLALDGDFSFDALSPDGSLMYLIKYLSPRDQTRYRVRVFDLRKNRLLAKPVVDPREPPGEMNGIPITRAASPDGRWAYTLYDGAEHPFVHALDTLRRRAVCIDLHALEGRRSGVTGVRLAVSGDGAALSAEAHGRALASIDTTTFEVTDPAQEAEAIPRQEKMPWLLLVVAASTLAAAAVVRLMRKPVSTSKT